MHAALPEAVTARADYEARFNRVVDHIQARLGEPMDLASLAGVACFSPCHFHRLFHAWMGETLHDFVLRLRLERAAARLAYDPGASITEIALDCGFSSSSTFARAFRAFHGQSASDWRRRRAPLVRKNCKANRSPGTASFLESPPVPTMLLDVQVRRLNPMNVAYADDRPCLEIHLDDPLAAGEGLHDVELCLAVRTF